MALATFELGGRERHRVLTDDEEDRARRMAAHWVATWEDAEPPERELEKARSAVAEEATRTPWLRL